MYIKEFSQLTKLSKKSIHYYIEESLISPQRNHENGYYIFTQDDIQKANLIKLLRRLNFSITDIHSFFNYPSSTNLFLHRQIYQLKKRIADDIEALDYIYQLVSTIPVNATFIDVLNYDGYSPQNNHKHILDTVFPPADYRIIAIFILSSFTDVKVGTYQQFLWDKITTSLMLKLGNNIDYLCEIIYSLKEDELDTIFRFSWMLFHDLSNAQDLTPFEDLLYNECVNLSTNTDLQTYWNFLYEPILKPILNFYNSDGINFVLEYNPRFSSFMDKMKLITNSVSNRLKKDEIDTKLSQVLNGRFTNNTDLFSDLFFIFYFKFSFFTNIPIDKLRTLSKKYNILDSL